MKMILDIDIPSPSIKIDYKDPIALIGSCFTEHIGGSLEELKFKVIQNPSGILFDPLSIATSLTAYIENRQYGPGELVLFNELWHSWQHHSRFSGIDRAAVAGAINASCAAAHDFLRSARWLIITLGSAFSYRLTDGNLPVANCHRAPATLFEKRLLTVDEINTALDNSLYRLFKFNPDLQVIFTVSPVRHIRDGVVDNNRSKARLIESAHHLVNKFANIHYFPAYELVIDVLRDYRYYDIDLVHPNYQATEFVIGHFMKTFVNDQSRALGEEVDKIRIARKHRPFEASTQAHQRFLRQHADKVRALMEKYPFLDLGEELGYFEKRQG